MSEMPTGRLPESSHRRFLSDEDRAVLREHHGLDDAEIEAEEAALAASYVPHPQYRKAQDRRSLRKQARHRTRATSLQENTMTAIHVSSGRTVPLNKLRLDAPIVGGGSWTNIREFTGLDTPEIEALGKRIKTNGITSPLLVQQVRVDDQIINLVLDGQRRFLGAREVFGKEHPIPVVDLSEEVIEELTPELADELTLKALTSIDREDLSSYELSTVAEKMKARGKTLDYIGRAINRDPSWVSKFLKARATATSKLMLQWRKGQVTDEQFKELAAETDTEAQEKATKEVVDARKSGDRTEARVRAKEVKEAAAKKVTNGHNKGATLLPVDQREQRELPMPLGERKETAPKANKPPSKVVLEEFLALAGKRPPTSDYVKGLFDGVRYVTGGLDPSEFSKAWHQYISRIEGRPAKSAKKKAGKKSAPKAKTKARKPSKGKSKR